MKRFLGYFLRMIQALAAGFLFLSMLSAFIHPKYLPFGGILTLGFVPIFAVNVLVWMAAFGQKRRLKYWNLIACCLAMPFLLRSIGTGEKTKGNGHRVLVFNSRLLNGYSQESLEKTKDVLKKEEVEVAALLEWHSRKGKISTADYKFQRFMPFINSTGVTHFGSLFLSKHPIQDVQRIEFPFKTANVAYYADVLIDQKTYRFYVVHLQSNKFSENQLKYVRNPSLDGEGKANAWSLAKAYMKSSEKRGIQADIIRESIEESPHPVVVLGDFNDTPQGYSYQTLAEGLKDSFKEAGQGWEGTYRPFRTLLRIDFILCSNEIQVLDYKSSTEIPSDHKYVTAKLKLSTSMTNETL